MSFSYLPWQIFVLLALSIAIVLLLYVKKSAKMQPKTMNLGLVLIAIGTFMAGVYKLIVGVDILNKYSHVIEVMTPVLSVIGIVFLCIGAYNKVKFDPERKRLMIIIISSMIAIVIIGGIIVALCLP